MSFLRWIGPAQFDAFWDNHWVSEPGKAWAYGNNPLALWLKERLRARPFYIATAWRPDIQRKHFAQMWGQIFDRHYDNPAMRDLFWLHEFAHWALVDFTPSRNFDAWAKKWDDNELMASFISEVLVHGESPDWDRAALLAPAWARQFPSISAQTPLDQSTWSQGAVDAWERRVSVRNGVTPPVGETEVWLSGFTDENLRWAHLWKDAWVLVDAGLHGYEQARATGDEAAMRAALDSAGGVQKWPTISYMQQALAFANVPR